MLIATVLFSLTACVERGAVGEYLQGPYENVAGTLDEITCICPNAGYITVDGDKKALCFPPKRIIECSGEMKVDGKYKHRQFIPPANKTWCPAQEIEYYDVVSYECLEK